MESRRIYEESYEEIKRVLYQPADANYRIDMSRFDADTKAALLVSITNTLNDRKKIAENVIFGAM